MPAPSPFPLASLPAPDSEPTVTAPVPAAPVVPAPVPRPRWWRRRSTWLSIFGLAVVAALILAAVTEGGEEAIDQALLATAKRTDLEVVVLETGRIEPLLQTQIKSKVGGQVSAVEIEEGARVTRGQVLLRLEPTDYRREVARMRAEVSQSRQSAAFASIQLRRAVKGRAADVASEVELDQARHEAALAQARMRVARVALETSLDQLRYTEIAAPFDGTIIQRHVQPGEVVVQGMTATVDGRPLLVLADMSVLLVKTELNQIDVAKVKKGQKAEVTLDALPDKKFTATVTRVAAAAVNSNGRDNFPVEAALDAKQDLQAIKPGMTADVRVQVEKRPKVVVLPIEAVVTDKGKSLVYPVAKAADGQARPGPAVEVTLGARSDREVEVKTGIREGQQVLIKPPSIDDSSD